MALSCGLTTPGSFFHFYTRWTSFWDLLFVMWKYEGLKGEDIFRKFSESFFVFVLFGLILIYGHIPVDCVPVWMHVRLDKWLAAKHKFRR
jgi:hypothetical protein